MLHEMGGFASSIAIGVWDWEFRIVLDWIFFLGVVGYTPSINQACCWIEVFEKCIEQACWLDISA